MLQRSLILAALVAACFVPASAQTITDPGFETPAQGSGKFTYRPVGSAWTFAGNSGLAGNGSAFTSGNPVAPQGLQVAFLQGTGSISQTIVDCPAGKCVVTFQAAQRTSSSQDVQVLVDGVAAGVVKPVSTSYQSYTAGPFTVGVGPHTITFQGLNSAGGDNTLMVDSVSIALATSQLLLSMDITDLNARIEATRARMLLEIFELERLHALLEQDAFVASATQQQRDQIYVLLLQIRRLPAP